MWDKPDRGSIPGGGIDRPGEWMPPTLRPFVGSNGCEGTIAAHRNSNPSSPVTLILAEHTSTPTHTQRIRSSGFPPFLGGGGWVKPRPATLLYPRRGGGGEKGSTHGATRPTARFVGFVGMCCNATNVKEKQPCEHRQDVIKCTHQCIFFWVYTLARGGRGTWPPSARSNRNPDPKL